MRIAARRWGTIIGLAVMLTVLGSARSEALPVTLTFQDLDPLNFGFQGSQDLDFVITNSTGETWTDFHLEAFSGVGAFVVDDYAGPGTADYTAPFSTLFGVTFSFGINITGINVADGGTLQFSQSTFCFGESCFLGQVVSATPTTDGRPPDDEDPPPNGVPEPSSLVLLGVALGGLGLPSRLRRKDRR